MFRSRRYKPVLHVIIVSLIRIVCAVTSEAVCNHGWEVVRRPHRARVPTICAPRATDTERVHFCHRNDDLRPKPRLCYRVQLYTAVLQQPGLADGPKTETVRVEFMSCCCFRGFVMEPRAKARQQYTGFRCTDVGGATGAEGTNQ